MRCPSLFCFFPVLEVLMFFDYGQQMWGMKNCAYLSVYLPLHVYLKKGCLFHQSANGAVVWLLKYEMNFY
jgi:hypothetical protein